MRKLLFAGTALALSLGLAEVAKAQPATVTFNPGAVVSGAPSFTADKLNLLNFSRVDLSGTTFNETGFLQVNNVSLNNNTFQPTGMRSAGAGGYTLYFAFNGTGTQSAPSFGSNSQGTFSSLSYTLLEAPGNSQFGINGSNQPFVTNSGAPTTLATGALIAGTTTFSANPLGAGANIDATFVQQLANFILSPANATLTLAGAFNNDSNIINVLAGGTAFTLNGGGGDITFRATANPVPEPTTLALLGTGLLGLGIFGRRRKAT